MRYCVDTWFLLELFRNTEKASRIFKETITGKNILVVPTISILELIRLSIRSGEKLSKAESMLNELRISQKVQIIALDETIAKEAAKVSVSYGISTVDSIIVATYRISECDKLLSKDDDLIELSKKRYLKIENW